MPVVEFGRRTLTGCRQEEERETGMAATIKRTLLGILTAFLLAAPAGGLLPVATTVHAAAEWCDVDPPVLIVTPQGRVVTVYALIGAQKLTTSLLTELSKISYTVAPANNGAATQVTLTVTVNKLLLLAPAGTPTRLTVSSSLWGSGTTYGTATGAVGSPMTVTFLLPVA